MLRTYLVTLADHETGKEQRILVRSACPDGMQEFVERPDLTPALDIQHPVVLAIKELNIKRPLPRTTLTSYPA